MTFHNKNTIEPVSEQDINDATTYVEARFDYLVLDTNPGIAEDQEIFWSGWQETQRQHIKNGDPIAIRNLAGQFREQQEQIRLRELGHPAVEGSLAA